MAIAVKFEAEPTTRDKYDGVRKRLEEAGDWPPPDLVFHAAYGESQVEGVFEVWNPRAADRGRPRRCPFWTYWAPRND
jgi:hypothetical protein